MYGSPYAGFGGAGGMGGAQQQQAPYPGNAGQWWSGQQPAGPVGGGGASNGWGAAGWPNAAPCGAGGGKDSGGKGQSPAGAKGSSKGKGGGKSAAACKFYAEGRCSRGQTCTFAHVDPEEDSDPELREINAAIDRQAAGGSDAANMARLAREEEERANRQNGSDNDSDSGDALPPPASEAEIEEARVIVQKALREAGQREKMKAKAKSASRDDLQAMINARLAMK